MNETGIEKRRPYSVRCVGCGNKTRRLDNYCYGCKRTVCPHCQLVGDHRPGGEHRVKGLAA